jgi:hypothetical protein
LHDAFAKVEEGEALDEAVIAAARVSTQLRLAGEKARADALLAQASGALERAVPSVHAWVHEARAFAAQTGAGPGEQLAAFRRASEAFRCVGDERNAAVQELNAALVLLQLGAHDRARGAVESRLAEARRRGLPATIALAENLLGMIELACGDAARARALFAPLLVELRRGENRSLEAMVRANLAKALLAEGALEDAEREARATASELERIRHVFFVDAAATLADVLLARGRPAEALETVMALPLTTTKMGPGAARVRVVRVEALVALGRMEEARAAAADACARLEAAAREVADDELRKAYLENVPLHVRTRRVARALGVELVNE